MADWGRRNHDRKHARRLRRKVNRVAVHPVEAEQSQREHGANIGFATVNFELEGLSISGALDDTGANVPVVSSKIVRHLAAAGKSLRGEHLKKPMILAAAKSGGAPIVAHHRVVLERLGLCYSLDEVEYGNGHTVLKNVTFFESPNVDEVLLGRDVCNRLGFMFANFLRENHNRIDGMELSEAKILTLMTLDQ